MPPTLKGLPFLFSFPQIFPRGRPPAARAASLQDLGPDLCPHAAPRPRRHLRPALFGQFLLREFTPHGLNNTMTSNVFFPTLFGAQVQGVRGVGAALWCCGGGLNEDGWDRAFGRFANVHYSRVAMEEVEEEEQQKDCPVSLTRLWWWHSSFLFLTLHLSAVS